MNPHQLTWLGQAGFALSGNDDVVLFDPYLSDLCNRTYGLVRQVEPPFTAGELGATIVLVSHWHEDHLDLDSAREFAESGAKYVAPPSCISRLRSSGVPEESLVPIAIGETVHVGSATVTAVSALHLVPGAITEDAVGFVLELDRLRIYHTGDSDYTRQMLSANDRGPLDAALLCMNGTGGNMNVWEAVALAAQLAPALAIPMHFGMWEDSGYGAGATLDPTLFVDLYGRMTGGSAWIPQLGVPMTLSP